MGERDEAVHADGVTVYVRHDSAGYDDQAAIGERLHLFRVRRADEHGASSLGSQIPDGAIDLLAGADVHALSRLVEEQDG